MKGRPVDQLVHEQMFPKPRTQDPSSFHALLQRYLILEVRQEVHSFYGHLETVEAKYPGLDYCHPTHRIRLSRWPWHRRLFRAFDALRLTPNEIAGLTKWEGTKWAKERYERENGVVIHDTTADDFPPWIEPRDRVPPPAARSVEQDDEDTAEDEDMAGQDSDGELESVGVALNNQLLERVAARNAGDTSTPLDEAWEQWLKQVIESGQIDTMEPPEDIFPRDMVEAARAGRWDQVPHVLHGMIRESLESERVLLGRTVLGRRSRAVGIDVVPTHTGPWTPSSATAGLNSDALFTQAYTSRTSRRSRTYVGGGGDAESAGRPGGRNPSVQHTARPNA